MEELQPSDPRQVGRYRITGRLGAGGMGQVYLGQSPSGRLVAVKVVRPELAQDPGFAKSSHRCRYGMHGGNRLCRGSQELRRLPQTAFEIWS